MSERLVDPAGHLGLRHALLAQAVGDVLGNGHVREQRVGLEDGVDVALVGRNALHVVAADADEALVGLLEPGEHAQRRGLAASRWAEQRQELARLDRQVEPVDRDHRAESLGDVGQLDRAALRHRHLSVGHGHVSHKCSPNCSTRHHIRFTPLHATASWIKESACFQSCAPRIPLRERRSQIPVSVEMDRTGTQLDDTDRAIIEQLQADGRIPYTRLGAAVGLSEAAVRQRVQRHDRRRRDAGRRGHQPAVARAAAHGDDRRAHRGADRRHGQDACRR